VSNFDRLDDNNIVRNRTNIQKMMFGGSVNYYVTAARILNNPEALEEIIQFYFEHDKYDDALTYAERLLSLSHSMQMLGKEKV